MVQVKATEVALARQSTEAGSQQQEETLQQPKQGLGYRVETVCREWETWCSGKKNTTDQNSSGKDLRICERNSQGEDPSISSRGNQMSCEAHIASRAVAKKGKEGAQVGEMEGKRKEEGRTWRRK